MLRVCRPFLSLRNMLPQVPNALCLLQIVHIQKYTYKHHHYEIIDNFFFYIYKQTKMILLKAKLFYNYGWYGRTSVRFNKFIRIFVANTQYCLRTYCFRTWSQRCFAYNIVPYCNRNQHSKNQINLIIISHKKILLKKLRNQMFKWTYGHPGNDYRVVTLSKSYLTTTEITIQSYVEIERTILSCLN